MIEFLAVLFDLIFRGIVPEANAPPDLCYNAEEEKITNVRQNDVKSRDGSY